MAGAFQSNAFLNAAFFVVTGAAQIASGQTATATQTATLSSAAADIAATHTATATQTASLSSGIVTFASEHTAISSQVAALLTGDRLASTQTATATQTAAISGAAANISSAQSATSTQTATLSSAAANISSAQFAVPAQASAISSGVILASLHNANSTQSVTLQLGAAQIASSQVAAATQTASLRTGTTLTVNPDYPIVEVADYPRDRVVTAGKRQLTIFRNMQALTAKTAAEVVPIRFDFSALTQTISNIDAVTVVNPKNALDVSLIASGTVAAGSSVTLNLVGGTVKQSYIVTCLISSGTAKYQLSGRIHINDY